MKPFGHVTPFMHNSGSPFFMYDSAPFGHTSEQADMSVTKKGRKEKLKQYSKLEKL